MLLILKRLVGLTVLTSRIDHWRFEYNEYEQLLSVYCDS